MSKNNFEFVPLSNENLYEFTKPEDNRLLSLSGFTGDTGSMLIFNKKKYLFVDGRFTIQAKREVKKGIKVITTENSDELYENIKKIVGRHVIYVNSRFISIKKYNKFIENGINIKTIESYSRRKESAAPLFLLGKPKKISLDKIYITSSLEEIAYLTGLRYRFSDFKNHGPLFDSFIIKNKKETILYIKDYLDENAEKILPKYNIYVKDYDDFYNDLKKYKDKDILIDPRINNYKIYSILGKKNDVLGDSPLYESMSIRNDVEIKNLRKANILDGAILTKIIYNLKKNIYKFNNEYDIKIFVDETRKKVGKNKYLCPSFETIVAYKENSAICHYIPTKNKSKKVKNGSVLLIDSGGHYIYGTTDITRTIAIGKVSKSIKESYTKVLNSMVNLLLQKFPDDTTGAELDIIARKNLYNDNLDFMHGTGHGIGYVSNVHEGPQRISPGIFSDTSKNILKAGQVLSDEPGLYFENKYGIRIENNLLVTNDKDGFLKFENLTLVPFDKDLIDKRILDKNVALFINNYNKLIYKKISKYLDKKEREWLRCL